MAIALLRVTASDASDDNASVIAMKAEMIMRGMRPNETKLSDR